MSEVVSDTRTVEIRIPSDPAFMSVLRQVTSAIGAMAGLTPEEANSVTLAIDEACTNVIKHAYKCDYNQQIVLGLELHPDRLEIRLRDYGTKCEPSRIKGRSLDEVRPGGLGVHIINEIMDEVEYDTQHAVGTELKMVRFLKPASSTDSTGSRSNSTEHVEGVKTDGS